VWLLAVPLLVAFAWITVDCAVQLLPNVL